MEIEGPWTTRHRRIKTTLSSSGSSTSSVAALWAAHWHGGVALTLAVRRAAGCTQAGLVRIGEIHKDGQAGGGCVHSVPTPSGPLLSFDLAPFIGFQARSLEGS
jgi:hypothetical protein